jgi:hypothetical protein
MTVKSKNQMYVLCIENKDCEDLEKRKIYQIIPDNEAEKEGYLRVVDESGEDYLYPESYFVIIQLPREAQEALKITA